MDLFPKQPQCNAAGGGVHAFGGGHCVLAWKRNSRSLVTRTREGTEKGYRYLRPVASGAPCVPCRQSRRPNWSAIWRRRPRCQREHPLLWDFFYSRQPACSWQLLHPPPLCTLPRRHAALVSGWSSRSSLLKAGLRCSGSLAWVLGRFRDVALSVRWRVVICRTAPQPKKCCSSASRTASNGCRNWGSLTGSFRRLARESWLGHLAKAVTTHDVQGSRVGHSFLVAAKLCKRLRGYERRNSELAEQLNGKRKDGVRRHARHSS